MTMDQATLPPPPRQTANPTPARQTRSVRRTSSIDVSWPDGPAGDRLLVGRARDLATPADGGEGAVLAQGEFRALLNQERTINAISAMPEPPRLHELIGQRGGSHLRLMLRETVPELIAQADPLYLVLDDISGTSLVSSFAWSQWYPDWLERMRGDMAPGQLQKMMEDRVNVCWGLAEGNSGLRPEGPPHPVADADAGELRNPADRQGWHDLPEAPGAGFRRARRIDVTRDEATAVIHVQSSFQDSAIRKEGGRVAIHEYDLAATADARTLELLSITPVAHILPFSECPGAIRNTQRLVGTPLPAIRNTVLAELRGPQGCTHLNDALRALAEVPRLAEYLMA